MGEITLIHGHCLIKLKDLADNSVDSVVTDPPYGLKFMNKKWDCDVPSTIIWKEVLRVLKPGGHLLSFGGTRTYHRMVCNIEDAGFEIRDQIQWLYGSGFPKSLDISKAIDKEAGAEREVIGLSTIGGGGASNPLGYKGESGGTFLQSSNGRDGLPITAPSTDSAKQWEGFGTALKPANEPIVLARKPLSESTVAKNVLKWGVGGLNVDGCRVDIDFNCGGRESAKNTIQKTSGIDFKGNKTETHKTPLYNSQGRFPANLILSCNCETDQHDLETCAVGMLDEQSGVLKSGKPGSRKKDWTGYAKGLKSLEKETGFGDSGHASRFFYCAKTSKRERNEGLEGMPLKEAPGSKRTAPADGRQCALGAPRENFHPTVKPLKLMSYLCRLITPPNGTVLDPFAGSGSTGLAAIKEGFGFIGIELNEEYFEIMKRRINA